MLVALAQEAKEASYRLARLSTAEKNTLLITISKALRESSACILQANTSDMETARSNGTSAAMLDRLLLTDDRLNGIANDVESVARLQDPVGQIIDGGYVQSGLSLTRRRVPLGVVGVIYEARPNVTVDVASLCLKTGNAVILRGGSETLATNKALVQAIHRALIACDLPTACVQFIDNPDRQLVQQLLKLDAYVDMIIPRGGAKLQRLCLQESTIPVIVGGIGVCHIFVDETADLQRVLPVLENAKIQRPSVCNAVETLLVHERIAAEFLPVMAEFMHSKGVTLHACPRSLAILGETAEIFPWHDDELRNEWLSLDLNVGVVESLDAAIAHIREYGSQHSDAILTGDMKNADIFCRDVDSSAVYVNTSTRFTDGGEFGLGAEVAVSTQKLHARGPMGLDALTTYKWIGTGDYLIRQ